MTDFTIKINSILTSNEAELSGVVKKLDVTATGGFGQDSFSVSCFIDVGPVDPAAFVELQSLTREEVMSWSGVATEIDIIKAHIESTLDVRSAAALEPCCVPWGETEAQE